MRGVGRDGEGAQPGAQGARVAVPDRDKPPYLLGHPVTLPEAVRPRQGQLEGDEDVAGTRVADRIKALFAGEDVAKGSGSGGHGLLAPPLRASSAASIAMPLTSGVGQQGAEARHG